MKRKYFGLHLLLLVISIIGSPILHALSINITSPNGGEIWPEKSFQTIMWESDGTAGYLQIEYSIDNGNNWIKIIINAIDNGSLNWRVPNTPSTNCLIRINNALGNPLDISDDVFTIKRFSCFVPDSLALVALYNSTNGTHWTYKDNWLTGPVLEWIGITMEEGRVVELSLTSNNLVGSIPGEFGNLSELKRLELTNNFLTGCIPPEMGNLFSLNHLTISHNQLTGSIPAELGNLTNLVRLYLYDNQLSGAVPAEIGNLSKLEILFLNDNNLQDLPDLNSLSSLNSFRIKNNYFTFEDIEPNINLFSDPLNYSPQKDCYKTQDIALNDGDNYVLSVSVGGDNNIYKWKKHAVLLTGMQDSIYKITNATLADQAVYTCDVESPIAINLIFSSLFNVTVKSDLTAKDSLALVALYNSTNGPLWDNNTNWLNAPLSTWYGVSVFGGRVQSLSLLYNNLSGILPEELGELSGIQILCLNGNKIGGSIPSEIGNLINLQYLKLNENQLINNIPIEIGSLMKLRTLSLDNNQLTGSIPSEIGNLNELQTLSLDNNQLTGNIPSEIGNLTNLTDLNLQHNLLSGIIPSEIGNLLNISSLDLYSNHLNGNIPPEIGNLYRLKVINLQYNYLTGSIPAEIGKLLNLEQLNLQGNVLDGTIPPEIGNLYNLRIISIYHNWLSGGIPSEIGNLSNLTYLGLWDNKLTGTIPSTIGNLSNLKTLAIYNNQLSGSIPAEIGNLSNLTYLGLMQNQLTGSIPPEIGNLSKLWYLHMGQNQLTGNIPPEIGNLSNLEYLSLYINELTDCIPPEIGDLSNLDYLSIHSNHFDGSIPIGIANLTLLEHLRIHNNRFTDLPPLSGLTNLEELTLESNMFTFEDIEPNLGIAGTKFTYSPQDSIGETLEIFLCEGDNFVISVNVGGENNIYQWYKDDAIISGANSEEYIITDANPIDEGVYKCHITNTIVTGLTLYSRLITVNILNDGLEMDSLALVALFNSTNGPEWINNTNWLTGPVSSWFGVTVNDGRVTRLMMTSNDMTGEIPAEIGNISKLESIHLNNNQLSGNIPHEIGNLSQLFSLYLYENQLSGIIPPEIYNLTNLLSLHLYDNNFSGTIPAEIGNLRNLKYLCLQDNELTGSIPAEIGNLKDLERLRLSDNQLTGNIPAEIGNLSKLTDLLLYRNHLSGNIPAELGNLSELLYLELNDNNLTGEIPAEIGNLTGLLQLDLSSNNLTGSIPAEMSDLIILSEMCFSGNQLSGSVPEEINRLVNLQYLYLKENIIENLPILNGLTSLKHLHVENNKLTFEDLEPNHSVAKYSFLYSPQDSVGERQYIIIGEGFDRFLSISICGEHNVYQWFKDGEIISGANAEDYEISNAKTSDAGIYECHITNTVATGLTLYSRPITVTVIPNTHPVVTDIPDQTVDEGSTFASINLDDYVSDVETADADVIWSHSGNTELVVTIIDRVASITTPDVNWNGSETITFTATDDNAVNPLSGSNAATFNVTAVNDAPVITGQNPLAAEEDKSLTLNISDFYVSDVDNPAGPFTLSVNSGSNYTVLGTTITPATNYNGILTIPVTVSDGIAASNPFDALVSITPVNDQPVVTDIPDQSIVEGGLFSSVNLDQYVSDIETPGADISWSCSGNSELMVSIINRVAAISVPSSHWNGSDTLTFIATDIDPVNPLSGSDMAVFTVVHKIEAPVLGEIPDQTIDEGASFEAINLDNFVEDDVTADENISWSYSGNVDLAIAISNRVATVTLPDENWNGSERIIFTATDDDPVNPLSGDTGALFTVIAVNDAPVVSDIPDQTIHKGEVFAQIDLDDFVDDIETKDENVKWSYAGNAHVQIEIIDCIAYLTLVDSTWYGSDTITFTAIDDDLSNPLSASRTIIFTVKVISGSAVISVIDDMSPYPNPTDRYVTIPWNHHENVKLTIEIANMNGEILSVQNDVIWEKQVEIDMHDLYPGVYYVRIITTDNASIYKVIKR